MTQESRLVIVIDSKNAEKVTKALNEELKRLDKFGTQATNSMQDLGETVQSQDGKLESFKKGIAALAAESKLYFAGIAGAAVGTTGALVALAVQTANTAAEIERLSYLSGATTTEFQEWSVGAHAMGIEMDKLSDIFKDVQDRVGDFITTGGGELSDFFTEIATKTEGGADGALKLAESMRELSGPQALQLYVDKLEEAGVSQSEMVFFMESVADEATALIPLLENGGEGFRLWAEAARNAGAIMDNETLAAAQRLKIESQLLEMQMTGLKNQFMSGLFPALNQIASAFTSAEGQALSFKSAGEAVGNTLIWLTKVGTGVAATFDIAGKVIGGAAAAMTNEGVTSKMVLDDIAESIDQWGTKLNKLNDSASNKKMTNALLQVQLRANETAAAIAKSAVNTTKMQETFDKASGSSRKVADNTARLAREAEKAAEEVRKIMYEYSSEESQKAIDLQKEITRLQSFGQTQYIDIAKTRYEEERKLAKMNFEFDLVEFSLGEEKKLRYSFNIREQQIIADNKLTKEQTKQKLEALRYEFNQELAYVKLAQEQRLFQSKLFLMSETDAIRERYRLERKEIELTVKDESELRKRLTLSKDQEQLELLTRAAQATKNWQSTYSELTGNSQMFQLDQTRQDRTGQSLALADSQNADVMVRAQEPNADLEALAAEQEAIWQAHRDRMALIDQDYWGKTKAYQLGMAADVFGGLSGVMLNFVDESSSAYRMMIAAQKGANLASVFMSNLTAISAAWSSAPFPANLPAVALTTAKTGVLQATLQAFTPQGFATGGQIRGPGTTTSDSIPIMASDKEFMFKASSAASIGLENLNYMNKTGELPPNHDAAQLSAIQRQQRQSDLINTSINQRNASSTQSAAPTVVDNQMVVNNVFNPKDIPDAMATPYGAKVFMNFIKLNKSSIRGMLGV